MKLSPVSEKFILHWGEMGPKWGVNRTVAQIQALLFLSEDALNAEQISLLLNVARSNVSNSLKELQSMKLIKVVQKIGDRRDYFESLKDVWELMRTILIERKEREFDPTVTVLQKLIVDQDFQQETEQTQKRIEETLALMEITGSWADEMFNLNPETMVKIMKLGTKIQKLLRSGKKTIKKNNDSLISKLD